MMLCRQNPKGGVRLKRCPLREENGVLGYLVGYCPCGEPLHIRTIDAREILSILRVGEDDVKKVLKQLHPRVSLRELLIHKLGGRMENKTVDNY